MYNESAFDTVRKLAGVVQACINLITASFNEDSVATILFTVQHQSLSEDNIQQETFLHYSALITFKHCGAPFKNDFSYTEGYQLISYSVSIAT